MSTSVEAAMESLSQTVSTEPPSWLVPNQQRSHAVRVACEHLFSNLTPHSRISPFDQFHIGGFDGEQIWQQLDLHEEPLLSYFGRELKKHPEEIFKLKEAVDGGDKKVLAENETGNFDDDEDSEDDRDMGKDEDRK